MNNVKQLEEQISLLLEKKEIVYLLQIGSNDGIDCDPIHDIVIANEKIFCYFIEPQREIFEILMKNYCHIKQRSVFINNAIFETNNKVKLFKNSKGTSGNSSLLLRKNLGDRTNFNKDNYELVDGITFETLLNRYNIINIDIIIIDTEGYDLNIIKQIMSSSKRPKIIFSEKPNPDPNDDRNGLVKTGPQAFEETNLILINNGYNVIYLDEGILSIFNKEG